MRTEQSLYALIYVFLLLLFGMEGVLLFLIPFSSSLQRGVASFLATPPWYSSYIGGGVFLLFLLLLVFSWVMHKKRYIRMTMECDKLAIEKSIIEEYVHRFFAELIPGKDPVYDVILGKENELDIVVELPSFPVEEKKAFFIRVQNELGVLLARKIGYQSPFVLTIVER